VAAALLRIKETELAARVLVVSLACFFFETENDGPVPYHSGCSIRQNRTAITPLNACAADKSPSADRRTCDHESDGIYFKAIGLGFASNTGLSGRAEKGPGTRRASQRTLPPLYTEEQKVFPELP
jgi:hypothetical protein